MIQRSKMDRLVVRLVRAQNRKPFGPAVRVLLYFIGVDIPRGVVPGRNFGLIHSTTGVVVHPNTVIGDDVTLFHNVTIGRANPWEPVRGMESRVVIEDGAIIAAGAAVLFTPGQDLVIGKGAVVGANAVITDDVPAGEAWAGNPARQVSLTLGAR